MPSEGEYQYVLRQCENLGKRIDRLLTENERLRGLFGEIRQEVESEIDKPKVARFVRRIYDLTTKALYQ